MTETSAFADFLGQINQSTKKPQVVPTLRATVNAFLKTREQKDRRPGVHVTDLVDLCYRKLAFKIAGTPEASTRPEPKAQRFFMHGDVIHDAWRELIYGPARLLYGTWECSVCLARVDNTLLPQYPCGTHLTIAREGKTTTSCPCTGKWTFVEPEVNVLIADVNVTGNADGLLLLQSPEGMSPLEMKSMRGEEWKELTLPRHKDVFQASIYAYALKYARVVISYIEKDSWDTKDFIVPVIPTAFAWAEKVMQMAVRLSSEPLKGSPKCKHKDVTAAKRCAFRKFCF